VNRRRVIALVGGAVALVPTAWFAWKWLTFPSDQTPEGAYLRVITAVNQGKPELFFAYTETEAQHASITIRNYRRHSRNVILRTYPEPERTRLAQAYAPHALAADGPDVFALYAHERGWLDGLRRDMSGIKQVEIDGERATVETVRGTRYPFRRRPNGIWGLTLFTATLVAEAEKAARDAKLIDKAAADYERAGNTEQ
jgi:hypothetical protein